MNRCIRERAGCHGKQQIGPLLAETRFYQTNEPRGTVKIPAAEYPRFVIQKRAATRLHYDLRLEVGSVLKSWAVTKGSLSIPKTKGFASRPKSIPLIAATSNARFPIGEYGGGTVMLWNRGFWTNEVDPELALRKCELKFTLACEKLKGSFVLVSMCKKGRAEPEKNGLLIKHRDGNERDGVVDAILADDRSVASRRSMQEIAAGKGRSSKPFIFGKTSGQNADAVWNSNSGKDKAKAELSKSKPASFKSAPSLLAKSKPWTDDCESKASLKAAIQKLKSRQ